MVGRFDDNVLRELGLSFRRPGGVNKDSNDGSKTAMLDEPTWLLYLSIVYSDP